MEYKKYRLGDLIEQYDEINQNGEFMTLEHLQGINSKKYFQECKSNKNDIDLYRYRICRKGMFAYNRATSRNGEKISIAYRTGEDCLISPSYYVFSITRTDVLLPEYFDIWMKRPVFDRYARFNSWGSATEFFTFEDFCETQIELPSVKEQQKIIDYYQVVDNRINLLNEININLEAQAQTYFNHMFGGFGPDDTLPNGWYYGKVGEHCLENIANLSKTDEFTEIVYLDTGSLTKNYISELQILNLETDDIPSRAKRKVSENDILYSTVRPNLCHYGLMQNCPPNMIASTGFAVLHNNSDIVSNELLYMWLTKKTTLQHLQSIAEMSVSTYPSVNVSDILDVKIIIADVETMSKVNRYLKSFYEKINENNKQIQILSNNKMMFVSKLISGN